MNRIHVRFSSSLILRNNALITCTVYFLLFFLFQQDDIEHTLPLIKRLEEVSFQLWTENVSTTCTVFSYLFLLAHMFPHVSSALGFHGPLLINAHTFATSERRYVLIAHLLHCVTCIHCFDISWTKFTK